jgi:hypothetical protein
LRKYIFLSVAFLLMPIDLAGAEQAQNAKCAIREQIVPTAKAARDIYKVLVGARGGKLLHLT